MHVHLLHVDTERTYYNMYNIITIIEWYQQLFSDYCGITNNFCSRF